VDFILLKKRLIAGILLKNQCVVQSVGFRKYLPIGKLEIVLQFLEQWDIDEVIILDLDASKNNKTFCFNLLREISKNIFVPLTIGGGISTYEDAQNAFHSGADKISINSSFLQNDSFLKDVIHNFGSQSVVVSADVKISNNAEYYVYKDSGTKKNISLKKWIDKAQEFDVGELLVCSIAKDGMKNGYDYKLYKKIVDYTQKPIIAIGGAGSASHIVNLFKSSDVDAAAIGNVLYFNEHSTSKIKSALVKENINVRPSCFISYDEWNFESDGKIIPRNLKSIYE
tara:strand:+ start:459 stop:1307 length:849 start_codon:yes stop_codon:yes gene_type:complete